MTSAKRVNGLKLWEVLNHMVLKVISKNANTACIWLFYQPKFPEDANKFKRI